MPAAGVSRGRVGLLTGCVQSVVFGDVNAATARVLAAEGYEVVAPRGQTCCGALHLHAGRREEGKRMAQALAERFAGVDAIAVNAAGCGSHLKDAGLDVRVADVSELLAEEPRAERHPLELRVAFQDSCHLSHAQGIRVEPRDLLDSIPGLERVEPAEQAICCGSAGIYNLTQPDAARELGDRKAQHVLATEPDAYASANPGCLVQVSAAMRRAGRPLPALHPIELLDASIRGSRRGQSCSLLPGASHDRRGATPPSPLSSCSPRSVNSSPDPATRSRTVAVTSVSPLSAMPDTRAATFTAMPRGFSPRTRSTSPVCTPARIWTPSVESACWMPSAQRIARAGPSKTAKKPSPAVSISSPAKRSSSRRTTVWCCSTRRDHAESPSCRAVSVEPTMSVKRIVARTRSATGAGRAPVRNSSISSRSGSASIHGSVLDPRQLDQPRAGNRVRELAPLLHPEQRARPSCERRA